MNHRLIQENRNYWTQRAPGYSEVNREELATEQHDRWQKTLTGCIAQRFPHKRPGEISVLEVGTGPGFFAILLAEAGYRVTAIDLTPSMLEAARENAGALEEDIEFYEMNAQALDFEDGLFDVVVSRNVTWNLPEPERGYAEWARVLKPGGVIINFDANWYRYLIDDDARAAYARDRSNSRDGAMGDFNVGEDFDRMEEIARHMPLTRIERPAWDVQVLNRLSLDADADVRVWERTWTDQEKVNFASTPMFMVCGYKEA